MSTICLTDSDFSSFETITKKLATGLKLLAINGFVQIDRAFDPDWIRQLGPAFETQASAFSASQSIELSENRFKFPLPVQFPINDPRTYANMSVLYMMKLALRTNFVIHSLNGVVAKPGAKAQHEHADLPLLFEETDHISTALPPYAFSIAIPLQDYTETTGTTRFWPGSHFFGTEENGPLPPVDVTPVVGSCYIWDYRIKHAGTENQSNQNRSFISITYARPWFIDYAHYQRHKPINMTTDDYAQIPDDYKFLFANARSFWIPQDTQTIPSNS